MSVDEEAEQKEHKIDSQLLDAVMFGRGNDVARLLDMGANVECTDNNGATPLIWAASVGSVGSIILLLKKGANINVQDSVGRTPLHHAAYNNHIKACEQLLVKGANPIIKDNNKKLAYKIAKSKSIASLIKKEMKKTSKSPSIKVTSESHEKSEIKHRTPLGLFKRRDTSEKTNDISPRNNHAPESASSTTELDSKLNEIKQKELAMKKQEQQLRLYKKRMQIKYSKDINIHTPTSINEQKPQSLRSSQELRTSIPIVKWEDLKILNHIGKGTFADCYLAEWRDDKVAVKKIKITKEDKKLVTIFKKECATLSQIRHPNIVLLMGMVPKTPNLSIITEWIERGDLYNLLHNSNDSDIRLDWKTKLKIALDVTKGMNYLHSMNPIIVHRDLKSRNILIDENWKAKVSDLGTSRIKENQFVETFTQEGTPAWMAPEVLRGEEFDEQADVFSFGVVLWELAKGEIPWKGKTAEQIIGSVGFGGQRLQLGKEKVWGGLDVWAWISECWMDSGDRLTFKQIMGKLQACLQ